MRRTNFPLIRKSANQLANLRFCSNNKASVLKGNSLKGNTVKAPEGIIRPAADYWVLVTGFSKFASRNDLMNCFGDIKPTKIEPILSQEVYSPIGRWALRLPASVDVETLKATFTQRSPKLLSVFPLNKGEFEKMYTASKLSITNCTVKLENFDHDPRSDDVKFYFRDFAIRKIRPVQIRGSVRKFMLVDFASPEEAERAMQTKLIGVMSDNLVRMVWYNV